MIILTGTYPPERCGVGDYTRHLLSTPTGEKWHLLYLKNWRIKDLRGNIAQLSECKDSELNIQYPTMGYRTSLMPHLLAIYAVLFLHKKLYITVHEYSQLGWKGKLALNFLFLFAKDVIFTTSFERDCAHRHNPWMHKGKVIKIRSNIPSSPICKPMQERKWDVGYFGYIRPLKGIEDFIPVAEQLANQGKRVYIMGQTQPEFLSYYKPLLQKFEKIGITYMGNKSQTEVADTLADTKIMFLPYPDGLSERRGSFLAAVVNGAAVVSTKGKFTSKEQKERFTLIEPDKAYEVIESYLKDFTTLKQQQENSFAYATQCVPESWQQIAKEYELCMRGNI